MLYNAYLKESDSVDDFEVMQAISQAEFDFHNGTFSDYHPTEDEVMMEINGNTTLSDFLCEMARRGHGTQAWAFYTTHLEQSDRLNQFVVMERIARAEHGFEQTQ